MIRRISFLIKCTIVFSSLILATTGTGAEDLAGSDEFVIGQHAYVAGTGFGLGVFDVIDRSRLKTPGIFLDSSGR